jgi:hypothetical protein
MFFSLACNIQSQSRDPQPMACWDHRHTTAHLALSHFNKPSRAAWTSLSCKFQRRQYFWSQKNILRSGRAEITWFLRKEITTSNFHDNCFGLPRVDCFYVSFQFTHFSMGKSKSWM